MANNPGGPWGGSGDGGGGAWGGGGRGPTPPELGDMLRQGRERFKRSVPGGLGGGKGIALVVLIAIVAWMLTGFYRVNPDEQGVELLFGRYAKTTGPGLNYWFPSPIGEVMTPRVTQTQQMAIGGANSVRGIGGGRQATPTSMMLTGDQNIIDVNFLVQWRIRDAGKFLFNIRDQESTIRAAAESAMREVVGQTTLESAMTSGRSELAGKVRDLLQSVLDAYDSGVTVLDVKLQKADPPVDVIDAFNDVQRARQDKDRLQNEATAYRNDILPRASGEAERLVQQAAAYRDRVVKDAEGEAARFLSVYDTYRAAKDVTTQRLYLETMQEVLGKSDKVLIAEGETGGGVVPYLPLPEIRRHGAAAANAQSTGD